MKTAFGWNLYASVAAVLCVSALFSIFGGLTAVMWTDFIQSIVMISGSTVLTIMSLVRVGGMGMIWERFFEVEANFTSASEANGSCSVAAKDSLHFFHHPTEGTLPWPAFFIGGIATQFSYWCTDQVG